MLSRRRKITRVDRRRTSCVAYYFSLLEPQSNGTIADLFSTVCTVKGDLSKVVRRLPTFQSLTDGRAYYKLIYDIVLSFGLTEIQAQICWKDANVRRNLYQSCLCSVLTNGAGSRAKVRSYN